jgi:hypothetical protein
VDESTSEIEAPLNPHAPPVLKATSHDRWFWPRLVEALDRAGYRIVRKPDPEMLARGKSARQKELERE